jgi:chromosome segregation ATPase
MTHRFLPVPSFLRARAGRWAAAATLTVSLLCAGGCQSDRALQSMSENYDNFIQELIDKQKREAAQHAEDIQRLRLENNEMKNRAETAERELSRVKTQMTEHEQALSEKTAQSAQLQAAIERAREEVALRDTNLQVLSSQAEEAKKQAEALEATRTQQA